ncbi:DUF3037 domain-containing protein [Klebsiella pneumoniae]|uniref:DUF3037 domain-containing protein n=1 Tax=Klebsiella pneumoniae TaxID=573 RepID=UPI0009BC30E8|nr:DUF3037 domain-containing protein [Klebsiella pneumoniae]EIX9155824.1 DUF3037 domain-containing protein [Klebsiella pneumoniae]MEA4235470.1 DUF3037 domain-containing protein [Klebsiella pneumoniae]MEA4445450.1 DUF3037 domain-containing protein [Klebsiella pneumoniae]MEA4515030.1 DUF3037 domain-containing protein [Klebsiella pneumoniae]MEA4691329.1 DUF3037 domain-containing protein [Klebsiella pneumoniae]
MKTPCLYSIIRYIPFAETEEFANVGILLCAPKQGVLLYKLAKGNDARVKTFFRDDKIFPLAKQALTAELKFARENLYNFSGAQKLSDFFHAFVSTRESIFQFSDSRIIMADNPAHEVEALYDRFVNHAEYTPERREDILAKELRLRFDSFQDLRKTFKKETIGGEFAKFTMPLVASEDGVAVCAIKPLVFDQSDTSKMMEHCDKWVARVTRAADERLLNLSGVLFPIAGPLKSTIRAKNAIEKIVKTFLGHQINCVDHENEGSIIKFAQSTIYQIR